MTDHGHLDLPAELFEPLAARIAEVSGIRVPVSKRWLLAARVKDRMRALADDDVPRYVGHVLSERGAAELGQLVEAVRVGETQFFRHQGQLRAIRRVALPEIVARLERGKSQRVRVWSAGCATGEEAYTLAMMLGDALPEGLTHEVLATDMSERALEHARAGRYPASSIHSVPPHVARWAFDRDGDDVVMSARARAGVRFEQRNLLSESYPKGFDLVLCRNVLIYFDRATQREVLERLSQSVVDGGYLALGYAERLDSPSLPLHPLRTDDGILYHRTGESQAVAGAAPRAPAPARPPGSSPEPVRPPRNSNTPARAPGGRPVAALSGSLEGAEGVEHARDAITDALSRTPPVLDLRELRYADDEVARVLARAAEAAAAEGRSLVLITDAPGTLRFLRRHNITPPAETLPVAPEETVR